MVSLTQDLSTTPKGPLSTSTLLRKPLNYVLPRKLLPALITELDDNNFQNILLLAKYYMSGSEISDSLIENFIKFVTSPAAEDFKFIQIFQNPLLKYYPLSKSYQISILKRIIAKLESIYLYIDEIFDALGDVMVDFNSNSQKIDQETYSHRCYVDVKSKEVIVIRKKDAMVVSGTTGLTCWRASAILAEYIRLFCDFSNSKLLELGAGCGLAGIAAMKYYDLESAYLTDGSDHVLEQLEENVRINFQDNEKITVAKLDWSRVEKEPLLTSPDVIIGADLIYDLECLEPLSKTLKTYLHSPNSYAIFTQNIRNRETVNTFLNQALPQYGLGHKLLARVLLQEDGNGISFEKPYGKKIDVHDEVFCSNYSFDYKTRNGDEVLLAEIYEIRRSS